MATLKIKITNSRIGQVTNYQQFEVADEIGRMLIAWMELMATEMPGSVRITRLSRLTDHAAIVDISARATTASHQNASFQQQHSRGGLLNDKV